MIYIQYRHRTGWKFGCIPCTRRVNKLRDYYLHSQIEDGFNCNQECYTDTQETQHEQQLTPCIHAYDHITLHINNLDDHTQQNTLYTMEEDASLFTSNTATPCDYNITNGVQNSNTILEEK